MKSRLEIDLEETAEVTSAFWDWYSKYPEFNEEAFEQFRLITRFYNSEFSANLGYAFLLKKAGDQKLPRGFLYDLRRVLREISELKLEERTWWDYAIQLTEELKRKYPDDRRGHVIITDILAWAQDLYLRQRKESYEA